MKHILLSGALAASLFLPACQQSSAPKEAEKPVATTSAEALKPAATHTFYLVRHAEKTKEADDPALTEAGQKRAELLADMLEGEGVTYIHSSDYRRTRDTARPLAERLSKEVAIYDAKDLSAIAAKLKATPGVHLVVGHSNTTPELSTLLSGQAMTEMPETEYDRFITVRIGEKGETQTVAISRFGASD